MTPRGRLRVDVPSPLARLILVPALPAFHARYPDIQIDMGVSDRVVDLIGDNVDCVLRGGQITDQSNRTPCRRFANRRLRPPSYVERLGAPAHPRELQNTDHCIVGFLSSRTSKIDPWYCAVRMNVLKSRATTYLPWMMAMLTSKLG
ncbi:LysR substrate-binding domain-containing protein [Klebsiella quasipneumoniae subsp. similipneumoniae]